MKKEGKKQAKTDENEVSEGEWSDDDAYENDKDKKNKKDKKDKKGHLGKRKKREDEDADEFFTGKEIEIVP